MILGIGIDVIEVKRIAKAVENERFLERLYTAREMNFSKPAEEIFYLLLEILLPRRRWQRLWERDLEL